MTKRERMRLPNAAETGEYPPGTTPADLMHAQNAFGRPALILAVIHNHLLPKTTIAQLRKCKDTHTMFSALHWCARTGNYIPATTTQDLIDARDIHQRSALHEAAASGHLLPNTTIQHLIDCKDDEGQSALHEAAQYYATHHHSLPPKATFEQLKNTVDNTDTSALCTALRFATKPLPGITATMLIGAEKALETAARFGSLPPDTTIGQLAECLSKNGVTALDIAAEHGNLPPNTTAQQLAECVNTYGITALHTAANHGNLPQGTTINDLTKHYDPNGLLPLHYAIANSKLPPNLTITNLQNTTDEEGNSAWKFLCQHSPHLIIQLPTNQLAEHLPFVVSTIEKITITQPDITKAAIICLGKVLAEPPPKPPSPQTTTTAWNLIYKAIYFNNTLGIQLPPDLFKNDVKRAIYIAERAKEQDSKLASAAAIWLAHTISSNLQQTMQQPERATRKQ